MAEFRVERFDSPHEIPESVFQFWFENTLDKPMCSPGWLKCWWHSYALNSPKRGCIYTVYAGETPVGLAPFYVRAPIPGIRSLRLMGDKGICSDHLSLVIQAGYEHAVTSALAKVLAADAGKLWDTMCLESVDLDDPYLALLVRNLQMHKLRVSSENAFDTWILQLPETWEQYLMSLSKNHRKRCRQWQKEFFDTGRAKVVEASEDDWTGAWQRLVQLNRLRRAVKGDHSAFDDPKFLNCHQAFLGDGIQAAKAAIRELYLDDQHVASEYILLGGETMYCYQGGMITKDHGPGAGNLSLLALLQDAIGRGYRQIDFLRGDEAYKQRWNAEPAHAVTWRTSATCWSGSVYRGMREALEFIRDSRYLLRNQLAYLPSNGTLPSDETGQRQKSLSKACQTPCESSE